MLFLGIIKKKTRLSLGKKGSCRTEYAQYTFEKVYFGNGSFPDVTWWKKRSYCKSPGAPVMTLQFRPVTRPSSVLVGGGHSHGGCMVSQAGR
jgi:hypothetical protein